MFCRDERQQHRFIHNLSARGFVPRSSTAPIPRLMRICHRLPIHTPAGAPSPLPVLRRRRYTLRSSTSLGSRDDTGCPGTGPPSPPTEVDPPEAFGVTIPSRFTGQGRLSHSSLYACGSAGSRRSFLGLARMRPCPHVSLRASPSEAIAGKHKGHACTAGSPHREVHLPRHRGRAPHLHAVVHAPPEERKTQHTNQPAVAPVSSAPTSRTSISRQSKPIIDQSYSHARACRTGSPRARSCTGSSRTSSGSSTRGTCGSPARVVCSNVFDSIISCSVVGCWNAALVVEQRGGVSQVGGRELGQSRG